jgi:ABC-type branched-subunit amino acid transport system ATPase component
VAVAHRRRIGELLVLAGPSGAGKTHLVERVLSGSDRVLAGRLGIERPEAWQTVTAQELRSLEIPEVARLLLHYDLLRPWRGGARSFARDEALDVLACAERVRVCTLYCPPSVLIARLERRCATAAGDGLVLAREALALYRQPGLLATTYAGWLAFCAGQGLEPHLVDASGDSYPELPGDRLPVPLQAER